jgi:hypothetical protein
MTGFEDFIVFVIRRTQGLTRRLRPAIPNKVCLGIVYF